MDQMKSKTKRMGSLLLIGVLVSIILLAGSLSSLELRPGRTLPIKDNDDPEGGDYGPSVSPILTSSTFIQGVIGLAFIIIIILLVSRMILHMNFSILVVRENLGYITTLAIIFGAIYLLSRIGTAPSVSSPGETFHELPPTVTDSQPYSIGEVPRIVIWLAGSILVGGVGLLIVFSLTGWVNPPQVSDQILQEAENAVHNLKAGKELSDVIVHCYAQMAQALREQRGIERNQTMTVREFEGWLEVEGIPPEPLHQLTSLFEAARYSKRQLGDEDQKSALHCLNEIICYCRGV